jgi:CsoR family transcriptional regulator, copper-sensing transcriptional repressor
MIYPNPLPVGSEGEGRPDVDDRTRAEVLKRLSYIGGHVAGIRKMTEADRYCVDILRQSYAVRKSLEKLETLILDGHLRTCVVDGMKTGDKDKMIDEILDVFSQAKR